MSRRLCWNGHFEISVECLHRKVFWFRFSSSLKSTDFSLALFLFPLGVSLKSDNSSKQFEVLIHLPVGIFPPHFAYLLGFTEWFEFSGIRLFLVARMHSILVVDLRLLCVVQGISYLWLCLLTRTKVMFSPSYKCLMIEQSLALLNFPWADLQQNKIVKFVSSHINNIKLACMLVLWIFIFMPSDGPWEGLKHTTLLIHVIKSYIQWQYI
jgi:hypothetical protein